MAYWLMKSNPKFFGIEDLQRLGTDGWDGVLSRWYYDSDYSRVS